MTNLAGRTVKAAKASLFATSITSPTFINAVDFSLVILMLGVVHMINMIYV